MRYEPVPEYHPWTVKRIILKGELSELRFVALSLSLHSETPEAVESVCLTLAHHRDEITRGNAVLALGHLARLHRRLTEETVRPVVEAALRDPDNWVRGQADAAADDIEQYLGWTLDRPRAGGGSAASEQKSLPIH